MFVNFEGEQLNLNSYLSHYLSAHCIDTIYIGCDSKTRELTTTYVCAICFHSTKGGHIIYEKKREHHSVSPNVRYKLWNEIEYVKNVADLVTEILIENDFDINIQVHVDIGNNGKSSFIKNESIGFITAFGYHCKTKPGAWAASFAADRFTD
jgi:predicted RNase H-related nuclease YkuK (DUF458 family)